MSPRDSQQPLAVDTNALAVTAIAQNLTGGKAIQLRGAGITHEQVKEFVHHVRHQLATNTFNALAMRALIDIPAWRAIRMRVSTSRSPAQHPKADWERKWDVATFLEALEEVFPQRAADQFVTTSI